ncbi:MAG: YidC/Oxa1 family membrane protein insertase [Coriobacteriia bacterium]|nr:YidC/Oxa1 family membrane protein insertase [Coriobacteriia bacterium]
MLEPIEKFLFEVLQYFNGWVGDYGFSIILLTVAIRLILFPLTQKQTKSTYELQRIQPKIKALQEKYKGNKEKLQEETLKFYQENKVNPLGGCLPLILQMPIFFALFRMLGSVTKDKQPVPGLLLAYIASLPDVQAEAARRFWIILPDITMAPRDVFAADGLVAALPYIIFVALFGLSIVVPQLIQPGERQQKMIGIYMGVLMLWFGWITPAGVLIYWITQAVLALVQQLATMRYYKSHESNA